MRAASQRHRAQPAFARPAPGSAATGYNLLERRARSLRVPLEAGRGFGLNPLEVSHGWPDVARAMGVVQRNEDPLTNRQVWFANAFEANVPIPTSQRSG